jgi:hypothetical protein
LVCVWFNKNLHRTSPAPNRSENGFRWVGAWFHTNHHRTNLAPNRSENGFRWVGEWFTIANVVKKLFSLHKQKVGAHLTALPNIWGTKLIPSQNHTRTEMRSEIGFRLVWAWFGTNHHRTSPAPNRSENGFRWVGAWFDTNRHRTSLAPNWSENGFRWVGEWFTIANVVKKLFSLHKQNVGAHLTALPNIWGTKLIPSQNHTRTEMRSEIGFRLVWAWFGTNHHRTSLAPDWSENGVKWV